MRSPERRKEYYPNQLREVNNACRVSGLELQAQLNAERCRSPIIFITAHGDEKMRLQAPSDGFHDSRFSRYRLSSTLNREDGTASRDAPRLPVLEY